MIALATVFWPWYARLVRGQVLAVRERDYVDAGRSIGMSNARLMFKHILPNCISVVIIQMTLDVGYAILATSSLSFIGLGATADAGVGDDDGRRAQLFPRRLVVHHISGHRADVDGAGIQPVAGGWIAGCAHPVE